MPRKCNSATVAIAYHRAFFFAVCQRPLVAVYVGACDVSGRGRDDATNEHVLCCIFMLHLKQVLVIFKIVLSTPMDNCTIPVFKVISRITYTSCLTMFYQSDIIKAIIGLVQS